MVVEKALGVKTYITLGAMEVGLPSVVLANSFDLSDLDEMIKSVVADCGGCRPSDFERHSFVLWTSTAEAMPPQCLNNHLPAEL